ncbi:MAG: ribonuclease Y, partial [Anaerococcus sp.]|nr:ribonuclease Y [Anaerococcus sp.]
MDNPVFIIITVAFVLLAFILGFVYQKKSSEKKIGDADELSRQIIEDANKQAETLRRETLVEAKDEISKLQKENDKKFSKRSEELDKKESRLFKKEESLDNRALLIDKKADQISSDQKRLQQKEDSIDKLIEKQQLKLQAIAGLTNSEAKEIILNDVKKETIHETAKLIKESEEKVKAESKKIATEVLATTIQRYAADQVAENTVSVVTLPNDEMKGRIIGREGRNIRAFEQFSGVDLIIDDTPEAVVVSSFEPVRREVAKVALERLIQDGRINPSRIEEMLQKAEDEVEQRIMEDGEQAVEAAGVRNLHPQLVRLVGKMKFRTSYGQNIMKHSVEVAQLAGMLAEEIGADAQVARRGGLLHDVGKAIDQEMEGTHVELGIEVATRYGENKYVINAIQSHHGEVEPNCVESILV